MTIECGLVRSNENEMYYDFKWQTTEALVDAIASYIEFYITRRIKVSPNVMTIVEQRVIDVA